MKYDQDELFLIVDFLEEKLESAKYPEHIEMFEKAIDVIESLIIIV